MAKELKPEQNPGPAPDVSEVPDPPKSYRLHILIALVALVLFQTIILAVALQTWFPPPGEPIIGLNSLDSAGRGLDDVDVVPPDIGKKDELVEISIHEGKAFKTTQTLDGEVETFSLVMRVTVKKRDEKKFNTRYEACKYTIDDRIESMLATSSSDDRKEAGSTAIKAKAKKIINGELRVSYVQEVLISEKFHQVQ